MTNTNKSRTRMKKWIVLLVVLILVVPYQIDIDYENEDWCPPGEIDVWVEGLFYFYQDNSYCDGVNYQSISIAPDIFLHKVPWLELVITRGRYRWNMERIQYSVIVLHFREWEDQPGFKESRIIHYWSNSK